MEGGGQGVVLGVPENPFVSAPFSSLEAIKSGGTWTSGWGGRGRQGMVLGVLVPAVNQANDHKSCWCTNLKNIPDQGSGVSWRGAGRPPPPGFACARMCALRTRGSCKPGSARWGMGKELSCRASHPWRGDPKNKQQISEIRRQPSNVHAEPPANSVLFWSWFWSACLQAGLLFSCASCHAQTENVPALFANPGAPI